MQTLDPVATGAALGLRPPTKLTPWEWAAANVKIQNSERSSKFDPHQAPWWMAPMECAADMDTRTVVVIAPTGSGKSTMAEALIPYVVSEDPGPMLYASQTDEDAKFWAESRLLPSMRSCVALAGLWPDDRHKSRKMEIIFPHMPLVLGGANLSNFQEKSVRWLYGDEVWTWKAGLVREFLARHHDRWNRKVFLVSQGGNEGGELHQEWKKTDCAEFSWRCKCGHEQPYSFDSLRFDKIEREDGTQDDQASADTARMECVKCREAYPDTARSRRDLATSNLHNGSRGYVSRNPDALRGHRGFHVDSLAVWWVPWASEVLGFLAAQRQLKAGVIDPLRQWKQKRRAEFWSEEMGDSQITVPRSTTWTKATHADGLPIEGEAKRFMTVDVGGNHFWAIIAAWLPNGGGMKVLWEGYHQSEGGDETKLADLAARYQVKPSHVFLDIAYDPDRILDLCHKHGWSGVRGEGKKRAFKWTIEGGKPVERLHSKRERARAKSGGIVNFFFLATNPIKDIVSRMLSGDGAPIDLPGDLSKTFEAHMKSERRETFTDRKTGEESSVWVTKHRQNHLWDCLVYQVGAALMFRLFDE